MLDTWEESESFYYEHESTDDFLEEHACLSHDDVEASGGPTRPLEFPTPAVYDAILDDFTAADHRTGVEYDLKNVLRRECDPSRAYLFKKKLAKSTYGFVKLCVVLERVMDDEARDYSADAFGVQWKSTGEFVAIKCSSWEKIQNMRGRHLVDPIKEISVLQLIGKTSSKDEHVMGANEVLSDSQYLYTVMPFYPGGDLYSKMELDGLQLSPDEDDARKYFTQLLSALVFLQRKGICHRNICIENLLLDEKDELVLIDSGLSLRVPYCDPCNVPDGVTDVSGGSQRRLMKPQGQCGSLKYLAPEMYDQTAFDGHATDLWAAGIALFITLVGLAPFEMPQSSDLRYRKIAQDGQLGSFLQSLDVSLSAEAIDLLQNMLSADPRKRLTLADVLSHPWVLGEPLPPKSVPVEASVIAAYQEVANDVPSVEKAKEIDRVETSTNTSLYDPATVSTRQPEGKGKRHSRTLSGARDLMGKLKFIIPAKKIGCGSSVSSASKQSKRRASFLAGQF